MVKKLSNGGIEQLSFWDMIGDYESEMAADSFEDAKWMSAIQKQKVYKNFRVVIDKRDISYMSKNLYDHLMMHLNYIAHYNIFGFKSYYEGFNGFFCFCDEFMRMPIYTLNNADYKDVNIPMYDYLQERYGQIMSETAELKKLADIKLLKELANKHNITIDV